MNFNEFSQKNKQRADEGKFFELWKSGDWTNAIAGEAGEACNLTKKIKRMEDGHDQWNKPEDRDVDDLEIRAAKEAADVIIYADLFIQSLGIQTSSILKQVFNAKSDEIGSKVKL